MRWISIENLLAYFRINVLYGNQRDGTRVLDMIVCLCTNGGTCVYDEVTTTSSLRYQLATCQCPEEYDGL